ncbi:Rep family protein [Vagococcus intermedius]|uniref:Rep family protein n=1 Tax=Vagococcus intermedius TaxID=2991418 RepID=A0AAF0CV59_9ENTE|nr:Rep family protein [Vagococcus intermedius]WEG73493.1 Rep family protein [Vagococcus intermedius]WEG76368.1 Rep family protein [Vagococcus intermedius]
MTKNPIDDLKSRTIMYENQIEHLEKLGLPTTRDELFEYFKQVYKPKNIAVILHDKDLNENGEYAKPHFHVSMSFENPMSLVAQANKINDVHQNFTAFNRQGRYNFENLFSDLCHRTKKSQSKFQYPPHDVRASFDYPEWLEQTKSSVSISRTVEINNLLEDFGQEVITLKDLRNRLTNLEFAKNERLIKSLRNSISEKRFELFKEEMITENKTIQAFYFFGDTGTGKTRDSKEKFADDCFVTGSNRDLFSNYDGQKTIIIDELRPETITYDELLKILDPFNFENVVGSRYFDKKLVAENIIITTPYAPYEFYNKVQGSDIIHIIKTEKGVVETVSSDNPDKPEQFYRRINIFKFEKEAIISIYFNDEVKSFEPLLNQQVKNKWSTEQTFTTKKELLDSSNKLFGGD